MGIDAAHYHAWKGPLRSPWMSAIAIVRTTLLQVVRRKFYWFIFAIGIFQFLIYWAVIYALTQIDLPADMKSGLLRGFGFSTDAEDPQDSGYLDFMEKQSYVVMILLAFCGSLIVGSDFRDGVLPFYLSRRADRKHYIFGKVTAVAALVWLLTVVPALLLFLEFGMFTTSTEYWLEHWRVVPSILAYGLLLGYVLGLWLTALSAYLQKLAPISIAWASLFMLLDLLATFMRRVGGERDWILLSPWKDVRLAGRLFFGIFRNPADANLSLIAAAIIAGISAVAVLALVRRVRAVEVAA